MTTATKQAQPTPGPWHYRPMIRPASMVTLPQGVTWQFVQAPWDLPNLPCNLEVIDHSYIMTVLSEARAALKSIAAQSDKRAEE